MALPASFGTITVTGTYVDFKGDPAAGTVTFTPPKDVFLKAGPENTIIVPKPIEVTLDGAGSFTVVLPVTDDPDVVPTFSYSVTENVSGSRRTYNIPLPASLLPGPVDLSTIVPIGTVTVTGTTLLTKTTADALYAPLGTVGTALTSYESQVEALADYPTVFPPDTSGLTKATVGLSNVDNTSDLAKPISTATQAALAGKVTKAPQVYHAEQDFGFVGDDSTNNSPAWDAMWGTLNRGDTVKFGGGVFRFATPATMKKSGVHIEGTGHIYWPYQDSNAVYGTVFRPATGFVGNGLLLFPAPANNGAVEVNNCVVRNLVINGNSVLNASSGDIDGIRLEGLTRGNSFDHVSVVNPSGHGVHTVGSGGQYPRGGSYSHVIVWSAGNLAGSTQWGFNFNAFTDGEVNNCHAIDCRGGGFSFSAPGQVTGTNLHAVFNNGVGIHVTGTSGNGGINLSTLVTDRNQAEGLLVDANGRQRVLVSNAEFRRDGGNGTSPGVRVVGTSTTAACPVRLDGVSIAVEDSDANDGVFTPVTGLHVEYAPDVVFNGTAWGRTNAVTFGGGMTSTDLGLAPGSARFLTGVPGSQVAAAVTSATQAALDAKASQAAVDAKAPIANPTFTGTVSGVTKAHVGLGNVDNTSDANKPISTATQAALNLKADLAAVAPVRTLFSAQTATIGVTGSDRATAARTIAEARMRVATAPVGSSLSVQVQHSTDGSSWTTVTTLTVSAGSTTEAVQTGLSQAQTSGNLVRLNVTSVGSTTPAGGVVVEVLYS